MSAASPSLARTPALASPGLPAVTCAFQPIVDTRARRTVSFEALARGPHNEPAGFVFAQVPAAGLHALDEHCRLTAIALATRLRIPCNLNLNLLPQTAASIDDSIRETLRAADLHHFPLNRIVLEVTEGEAIGDLKHFAELTDQFRAMGLKLAIDDFGAGYAGLNLLADFQPDQLKLDRQLVSGIESNGPRQAIVRGIAQVCLDLGIDLIAEGVETRDEYTWFADLGVTLFQGYFFAPPAFQSLPVPTLP